MKGRKFVEDEDVICTAYGWLEEGDQQFFCNGMYCLECLNWAMNGMVMVDADGSCHFRRTLSPSRLAWSEGWRPPRR